MFERNVAHLASRWKEVRVTSSTSAKVGFLAGLDEKYIQLCVTSNGKMDLILRDKIITLEETGRSLEDQKVVDHLTPRSVRLIRDRCSRFAELAAGSLKT